ncbi:HNH endonuclease [Enterococcus gallinarum]|uniref:HNH endonuclease n=1 Tax=Enterococcus gallinarum TaxID=1353 RepID=UPI00374E5590
MKYCGFDGCQVKIERGTYCKEHAPRRKAKAKKSAYHHENKSFYRTQAWKEVSDFVYEREGGRCQRCGRFVFGKQAHRHHVVPIKKNDLLKLDPNNIRLLCPKCHVIEENETDEKKIFPSYFN